MANPEHIAILEQGVERWNKWRNEHHSLQPDLSHADFNRQSREEFTAGLNIRPPNFRGVRFDGVDLRSAVLSESYLERASFRSAYLDGADLSRTHLGWTDFTGASLRGASLADCIFHETTLANCDLSDAKALESTTHHGPSTVDHRTLSNSGRLPLSFLRGCGLPETFVDRIPELFWTSPGFYSCFISYSHADKGFAHKVHDTLQERGIRCWLDEKDMNVGDDIHGALEGGISRADKLLLCCSEHSLTSRWVDKEVGMAFDKEEQLSNQLGSNVMMLVPLDLDGHLFTNEWTSGYRAQIRRRRAADFTGWSEDREKFDEGMTKVVRALRFPEEACG